MESSRKEDFSEASAVHKGEFWNFLNIGVAKVYTLEQSATVARMRSNSYKMLCESECVELRQPGASSLVLACSADPRGMESHSRGNGHSTCRIHGEKLRVATLHGRLPTSPGSLAHNRLSHSSGTVRNLSLILPNTSENFKCCTSCSQTLAPFSHTSQTNWP